MMYVTLFDYYISIRKSLKPGESSTKLVELFTLWNAQLGVTIDLEIYENLVQQLVYDKKYEEARNILKISKDNKITNFRHFEFELRLSLKLNDHDAVLRTLSEAFSLNHTIDENVAKLVMKNCFKFIETIQLDINEQEITNKNFREINNNNNNNNITETESNELELIIIGEENENKLKILQLQKQNIMKDLESISSNLVYQERGSVESFTKLIRHWREGGPVYRDRLEVISFYFLFILYTLIISMLSLFFFRILLHYLYILLLDIIAVGPIGHEMILYFKIFFF